MQSRNETVLDRQKLYDEVWADPVVIVAQRYGLSDVGLAKICRKLSIPLPSRGYWAKLKAGRIMKKVPLPLLKEKSPGRVTVTKADAMRREATVVAKQKVSGATGTRLQVSVPAELSHPHPLVKAAAKRLKQREGWTNETGIRSAPTEVLHLQVTRSSLDRALLIVDTVIKELEKQSVSMLIDAKGARTIIDARGTMLPFTIVEQVKRRAHQDTPAEKRAKERYWNRRLLDPGMSYPHTAIYDYERTGLLTITVGRWPSRNWNDTSRTPLEKRMAEVVTGIIALAEEVCIKEAEEARRKEKRRLEEERYAFLMKRRKAEQDRFNQLETDAINWERANRLRRYLDAYESKLGIDNSRSDDQPEWVAWVRAKADWLDPSISVSDPILDAPEPKLPSYH